MLGEERSLVPQPAPILPGQVVLPGVRVDQPKPPPQSPPPYSNNNVNVFSHDTNNITNLGWADQVHPADDVCILSRSATAVQDRPRAVANSRKAKILNISGFVIGTVLFLAIILYVV
ncbi:hypothetical protein LSH36_130g01047 [Paralvinella palmiformis]|uniref:Uncharacterized protein n=1 Tax=Paralvinella palmiformis TaxID=53620 RepID=A0AAD9JXK9_9ANNE|nr:hypothetical protein LSH36_130g01047 [Paralvinella palmiformis]